MFVAERRGIEAESNKVKEGCRAARINANQLPARKQGEKQDLNSYQLLENEDDDDHSDEEGHSCQHCHGGHCQGMKGL